MTIDVDITIYISMPLTTIPLKCQNALNLKKNTPQWEIQPNVEVGRRFNGERQTKSAIALDKKTGVEKLHDYVTASQQNQLFAIISQTKITNNC